jgi:RHS repeat-associated protein
MHRKSMLPETNLYFYHPDHLGSSSFITDATGYATQHLQYLPFGETFVDQQNGYDSRYTFSAKEKDDETQYSYFGARYYDSDLSVWLSVDPLSDKYPSTSSYMYCLGNPVTLIDPDGMASGKPDNFVFDESGDFVRIEENNQPDKLVIENSQTGSRDYYEFSDPESDPQEIREGIITDVAFVSKDDVISLLNDQGAFSSSWVNFAAESVGGGDFDYSYQAIPVKYSEQGASYDPMNFPSSVIFLIEGENTAQNHMNFGNFLWAATGYSIGFDYASLQSGAQFNSKVNSRRNGYESQWDSADDQRSIIKGAFYAATNNFRNLSTYGDKAAKR